MVKTQNPIISTIIITHNQYKLFKRALESVLSQNFTLPREIIVVNDSSTDETHEYMQHILLPHPEIVYKKVENHSALLTRKDGIDLAKGEYITFLDGDDYYHRDYLKVMYDAIIKNNADVVNCSLFYVKNGKAKKSLIAKNIVYPDYLKACKALFSDYYVHGFMHTKIYKGELLKSIDITPFKKLKIYEDSVMNFEVLSKCSKLVSIKKPLLYYNKDNQNSLTNSNDRIKANIMSSKLIRMNIDDSHNEELFKVFSKSYLRKLGLLLVDIKMSKFKNKQEKKYIIHKARKDLKFIYKVK